MGRKGSGVEIRARDYRVRFTLNGERYAEPVDLKPTIPHTKHVMRLAAQVQAAIAAGTFSFAKYFPDSKHAARAPQATFGTMRDLWLRSRGTQISNWQRKKDALHSAFWLGKIGADRAMSSIVASELEAIVGDHAWPSAKHRNNMLTSLRGIFDLWVRDAPRDRVSPAAGISNGKVQRRRPDPFDVAEADAVVADMRSHYDQRISAYFDFAFYAGMRPEEQIALLWTKVDGRSRTVVVDLARTAGAEKETKTHVARVVHLNSRAWAALQSMRSWTELKDHGHVFENPRTGRPWVSEADQRDLYWTPTLKRLRMRHRRAYQTRSTCATMYLMMGREPGWIARELGHSERVFWDVYAEWIPRARRGADLDTFDQDLEKLKSRLLA